jgi:hypothetical protein
LCPQESWCWSWIAFWSRHDFHDNAPKWAKDIYSRLRLKGQAKPEINFDFIAEHNVRAIFPPRVLAGPLPLLPSRPSELADQWCCSGSVATRVATSRTQRTRMNRPAIWWTAPRVPTAALAGT